MEGDDMSEISNRLSAFGKTLYEVLHSYHYPSCERSNTHKMDVSAGDSCNGQEHYDCRLNYGVLDSFCDSRASRPGNFLKIPQCSKKIYNLEFSWCDDHPTRQRLETYGMIPSSAGFQISDEGVYYSQGSQFFDFEICQWLKTYEVDEMSYKNSCDSQIVSSGDSRSSHERPYYPEVSDFYDRETCRWLGIYQQVDEKSWHNSCDFQIHQRSRTYRGVGISGCSYQRCQERPLYGLLDPGDYQIPQRWWSVSDTDEICSQAATLKTYSDVLDQRNTWVLVSCGSQLRRLLETSKISEMSSPLLETPKTDCSVLLGHPPQVCLGFLKSHKISELCGLLGIFEDYRTVFSGTFENKCGGWSCSVDSQVYERLWEIIANYVICQRPNSETFQEKVCGNLDFSWPFGTLKFTFLWRSTKNEAICVTTFGKGVFGRLVSCHYQIRKHLLFETRRNYVIFSGFASWSWAASWMIVSLLVGSYYASSRSTTMDKLCLLLAVCLLIPQGFFFCASEVWYLFFAALFFGGPPLGLASILPVYFIGGCGWLLGSRITIPFDSRGCGMNDDTTAASLYASLRQERRTLTSRKVCVGAAVVPTPTLFTLRLSSPIYVPVWSRSRC
eukprot:scaffold16225_cov162-Cylindrotheca_fusiformis.AAC.2